MATIAEILNAALTLHKSGNLVEAERLYREVLKADDQNVDAWQLLGHLLFARGDASSAIDHLRRAVELDGAQPSFHNHLAEMYGSLGKLSEAEACCRQALRLNGNFAAAHQTLGMVLMQQRRFNAAIDSYRQAIALQPDVAVTHYNLGTALRMQGSIDAAIDAFHQVLRLDPRSAQAEFNLGVLLQSQSKFPEAMACFDRALAIEPDLAEAHCARGVILHNQDQLAEAAECYRQAIRAKPDLADAHNNLGTIYRAQYRFDEAIECYQCALEFRPDFAEALTNLGHVYNVHGRTADAAVCYDQSLRIDPHHPMARYSRAVMLLAAGDFERGWVEYESRFECSGFPRRSFSQPVWKGRALNGRTLLVHAEQALGDTIQFARYVKLLEQGSDRILFEIPRPLLRLFEQSGFRNLVAKNEALGDFDVHLPLLSLPRILRTTLETIPASRYLSADHQLIELWRRDLTPTRDFKVGIAWRGSAAYLGDRFRSIPLTHFAPLAQRGVELISLQKGAGVEQIADVASQLQVRDLGASLDEEHGAFMDTAAIMKSLDLVVTCDSAVAHLAGALGVNVWVALPLAADWRWMYERTDSPWYPTVRLFRQTRFDDWPPVFEAMAEALRLEMAGRR